MLKNFLQILSEIIVLLQLFPEQLYLLGVIGDLRILKCNLLLLIL